MDFRVSPGLSWLLARTVPSIRPDLTRTLVLVVSNRQDYSSEQLHPSERRGAAMTDCVRPLSYVNSLGDCVWPCRPFGLAMQVRSLQVSFTKIKFIALIVNSFVEGPFGGRAHCDKEFILTVVSRDHGISSRFPFAENCSIF